MIDPVKSLLIDAEESWSNMPIGSEVTTRDVYRAISSDNKFDIHKLSALEGFLNKQINYGVAEIVGGKDSDPRYKKILNESVRAKNKRFCDVINDSFADNEEINLIEFSLRYKNMNPHDPITKNYIVKLLYALERHKCIDKIQPGLYVKLRNIEEHEMTTVTRYVKIRTKAATSIATRLPPMLPRINGYATVKSETLTSYIKEIETLKLIVKAQRKELDEKTLFIASLPRVDLPALDTAEYEDLKKKYGIQ